MGEENRQWNWQILGLGGVLNMLENLATSNCVPNRHRITDLKNAAARLNMLIHKLESGIVCEEQDNSIPLIKEGHDARAIPVADGTVYGDRDSEKAI